MMWHCCQCGNKFDYDEGDTEERMCFECLNEDDDEDDEDYAQNMNIDSQIWDFISLIVIVLVCYYFYSHLW